MEVCNQCLLEGGYEKQAQESFSHGSDQSSPGKEKKNVEKQSFQLFYIFADSDSARLHVRRAENYSAHNVWFLS